MSYHGWTNRETWLVPLWFNPETEQDLEQIKDYLEEVHDKLPGFFKDYIDLSLIEWDKIKEHLKDE